ncbi:NAD(P)/FAD-dependent oxidoreductase [Hyphococcus flavus]|uniref:NAD(P)/FAD-dependent oxidoreductase n=1 Tax=Hyphococcus flavus TaxID=1866326 RepID=A0AAE9ZC44_9PROT|nr:NAD(P)/FAD-dependent oxidoreductase [Hyphococcus flavus]WDI31621.1 NAD(P)/FAD-dependent oxidoreductase [Hyphococcus flavus]
MTERVDAVVIGAGVIGLAVARALGKQGREVIVLEKNGAFGEETSARNSEVIHAGIQYKPDGVRASLAVRGRDALYRFCADHNVNHSRCGKLLVAIGEKEVADLEALKANAERNGVDDLKIIDGETARKLEPGLFCDAAILSPSSGIVDSHGLMLALLGEVENAGGVLALSSPVVSGSIKSDAITLNIGGADPMTLEAKTVVNCAGLWSDRVARSINGLVPETIPTLNYGKGQYFTYSGAAPFKRLIYPLPSADSQGVHYTRDLGGQGKLGPDITFIDTNTDYSVDASRRDAFAAAARRFWPDLDAEKLQPGYAGIRPKLKGPGEEGDFLFSDARAHGVSGYLGLYGIESPGLTTCLAVAEHAALLTGQSSR